MECDAAKDGAVWTVSQTWGFEVVTGERRHKRHLQATNSKGYHGVQERLVDNYDGWISYMGENKTNST
ncbi:hypothetical protein K488DRAFT_89290 [Vararia minispora EC-137]|uniref:Uncharacterized protein n=1 Tax=Vararia minispora EC-137 TaxID=1314806 RepID=A0ACB8QAQ6_9AGAM|nr:hypothetical protein K488DRAFT_89290 [Vararia minispora EC-137]